VAGPVEVTAGSARLAAQGRRGNGHREMWALTANRRKRPGVELPDDELVERVVATL
jgi:hypothetical protein